MSYSFNPKTDEEIARSNLLEAGVYNFEVGKAERQISQSNNPMAKLNLKVWDANGLVVPVFDYLVFSDVNLCIKKVKHFCEAVGLAEEYKQGQIPEELEGYSGKLELKVEEGGLIPDDKLKGKPKGSKYPDKNVVVDYIKRTTVTAANKDAPADDFFDDPINF